MTGSNHNTAMKSLLKWFVFLVGSGVLTLLLAIAFIWFSGGNGQASQALATPELILEPGDTRRLFTLDAAQSEARFSIDELLLGEPTTVIGRTQELAGEILIDLESPENSELGAIVVNVGTLRTDNEFRNRALRGQILQANNPDYEVATFVPSALIGLPEQINIGDTVDFQIEGTLFVHGVNQPVVFDAQVTVISNSVIEGYVSATVRYEDFDITIPEAAGVADVSDEVVLELDFVATSTRTGTATVQN